MLAERKKKHFGVAAAACLFGAGYLTHFLVAQQGPVARTCHPPGIRMPDGTLTFHQVPFRHCLSLGPLVRIRGVWTHGFEANEFIPAQGSPGAGDEELYLDISEEHAERMLRDLGAVSADGSSTLATVELDLLGRISKERTSTGMGIQRRVIVVERTNSRRLIRSVRGL